MQALLALSVSDPACGCGHFLLAAARRIAEDLARLSARCGDGNAAAGPDYRHALRDVVAHCIYGVDKNPLAVELARTALWLEAYTPDRPLTFLDHHLRCGDALLGILDPAILEAGIPDKAFNALSGDDKTVVTALKKANRDAPESDREGEDARRLQPHAWFRRRARGRRARRPARRHAGRARSQAPGVCRGRSEERGLAPRLAADLLLPPSCCPRRWTPRANVRIDHPGSLAGAQRQRPAPRRR